MKAVQVVSRGRAEFVEVPKPEVRPGHALIRVSQLALCGSDIQMLCHAADSAYPFPPGTTGHEMVGVVEAVDAPGSTVQPGDRVLALAPGHLAMCEWFLARIEHVVSLPDGPPLEHLLQAQQLGTVIYATQRLPNIVGKSVAVIGQGSAGLWFDFQLRRLGARRVIALDLEDFRLRPSRLFGATDTIHNVDVDVVEAVRQANGGELPDLVVEAAGEVDSINLAIDLVRKDGEILYFGYPRAQTIPLHFDRLFHKCCRVDTVVGAFVEPNQASTRMAVELIAGGLVDVSGMITHRFPFKDVMEAYETHRLRKDGAIKILVDVHE